MEGYISEREQIEQIKAWWNKYGNALFSAVLVVVLLVLGMRWWEQRSATYREQASSAYLQLLGLLDSKDTAEITARSNDLIEHYPGTPYSDLAHLFLARDFANQGKTTEALQQLQTVIEKAKSENLKQIARIRSAAILIQDKKADQAIKTLETVDDPSFMPVIAETRGDAYTALGQSQQAHEQYALAKKALGAESAPYLELKITNSAQA
jgi:predicted negative regulator of RcsB-dependent stress response